MFKFWFHLRHKRTATLQFRQPGVLVPLAVMALLVTAVGYTVERNSHAATGSPTPTPTGSPTPSPSAYH